MDKAVSNVFENVTDAHKQAFDAILGFNKIAVRTQGLLAGQHLAALEKVLDAGSRNLQLVSETRDPRELMARQTEVAVELGETLVAVAREEEPELREIEPGHWVRCHLFEEGSR